MKIPSHSFPKSISFLNGNTNDVGVILGRCQEGSHHNGAIYHRAAAQEQRKRDAGIASASMLPPPQKRLGLWSRRRGRIRALRLDSFALRVC
jgi:hypothetical protein